MCFATERKRKSHYGEAGRGLFYGLCIGLVITFLVGATGYVLMHFCIVPWGAWCSW